MSFIKPNLPTSEQTKLIDEAFKEEGPRIFRCGACLCDLSITFNI